MTEIGYHWWWRPGWHTGRRCWTVHITWRDQPAVQDHAHKARKRLRDIEGLDLIPGDWLHCTMQGIGFADEVTPEDLEQITDAVRTRLASVKPVLVTLGSPEPASEGVACWVGPAGALDPVRDAVRAGIGDVWGTARVPETREWRAHVSIAYASTEMDSAPVAAALSGLGHADAVVTEVQLLRLGRDRRLYEWDVATPLRLGSGLCLP